MEASTSPRGANGAVSRERMSYMPVLSREERDRRWAGLRAMMTFEGIDCLIVLGKDASYDMGMVNFRYITHIASKLGGYCVFPVEGDPVVFTGLPHMNLPRSIYLSTQDWVEDVRANRGIVPVVDEIKQHGWERGAIGIVAFGMTVFGSSLAHHDMKVLHESLPHARIVDLTGRVDQLRVIKSDEEIEMMRRAGELARLMVETMRDTSQVGVRECSVWAAMLHAAIDAGGEPNMFNLLSSGSVLGDPAQGLEHLAHGADLPGAPSMRPLQDGDLVVTELHASWGGYLAAAEYSVCVGRAPDPLRRIHEVAIKCFYASLEELRPGRTVRDVIEATRAPCLAAGMDYVELGMHGHGLSSPENPIVVYKPGEPMIAGRGLWEMELQENMVFGNNIDIFDPAWRPDVGIMFGDMVRVTASGPELMCETPTELVENPA